MRTKRWAFIIILALATTVAATNGPTITFDRAQLSVDQVKQQISWPDGQPVSVGANTLVSAVTCLIELSDEEYAGMVRYEAGQSETVGQLPANGLGEDIPTSVNPSRPEIVLADGTRTIPSLGKDHIEVTGEIVVDSRRYARLLVFPVTLATDGTLRFAPEITIHVGSRLVSADLVLKPEQVMTDRDLRPGIKNSSLSGSVEYVIITSSLLANAFETLAQYKEETGYTTEVKLIEDIVASYSGRDDAERLREYLKEFYAAGGQYVLLGGNETVVPVRYAYHYRTDESLPIDLLQICDLYFGDMNGNWEVDNDGIWGERYDDDPDLETELYVGRLPFDHPDEVAAYIDKLITYETDPGGGDRAYLRRTFFFSSDQMRDYSGGGQHGRIAAAFPEWFDIDTANGVELSSGDAVAPYNQLPSELTGTLSTGFGIVNIIAHGRNDGFTVRSSGYSNWPKAYFLTGAADGTHGCIDSISTPGKPALYYSLACDNGGFDIEQAKDAAPGLARRLLCQADGGAVCFIGQSRWGWVGSSHLLQKAFFDTLFASPGRPAIEAFTAVKKQYYYYRDLIMGQNFLGDPTLKVYTDVPELLDLDVACSGLRATVSVTDPSSAVSGCRVVLSENGEVIGEFTTDPSGTVSLPGTLSPGASYTVSAVMDGYSIGQESFVPSIAADVDDEIGVLPHAFALNQNYPNPFNPSTVISFELPKSGRAALNVFNVLGQKVATLQEGELAAGAHEVHWNACDESGHQVASGVYFYQLETDEYSDVKKMVLTR